jgi:hypothetical protein
LSGPPRRNSKRTAARARSCSSFASSPTATGAIAIPCRRGAKSATRFGLDEKTARSRAETAARRFRALLRRMLAPDCGRARGIDDQLRAVIGMLGAPAVRIRCARARS